MVLKEWDMNAIATVTDVDDQTSPNSSNSTQMRLTAGPKQTGHRPAVKFEIRIIHYTS